MTPAAAAILEGMPDPSLLHRLDRDGTTWILAGSVVLACYPSGDAGLRNGDGDYGVVEIIKNQRSVDGVNGGAGILYQKGSF